jgi:hypothetical protein
MFTFGSEPEAEPQPTKPTRKKRGPRVKGRAPGRPPKYDGEARVPVKTFLKRSVKEKIDRLHAAGAFGDRSKSAAIADMVEAAVAAELMKEVPKA